jgi:hypothetical protein
MIGKGTNMESLAGWIAPAINDERSTGINVIKASRDLSVVENAPTYAYVNMFQSIDKNQGSSLQLSPV